jgi:hypothetical protein
MIQKNSCDRIQGTKGLIADHGLATLGTTAKSDMYNVYLTLDEKWWLLPE